MRGGRGAEFVAAAILALGTWLGLATSGAPATTPGREAPGSADFSITVANKALAAITRAPHPVGTAEHDRVRDYLVDQLRTLGANEVHVQSATGFTTLEGPLAATVANVVARKRGRKPGPAILLSAHYDAVPRSFGAGDDGVGVAAILGTLAAISNGPPLDHDLIITFVDAEENGLLGAEAFVHLHPWAKDVGVVLNFDGRGTKGPVYMFQTSLGNSPLIAALTNVANARTNSLTGEVYRHLPANVDTDMSIWLHSGFPVGALNFAHVGGFTSYHTPLDNTANLDPRIVPEMGEYALSLVRALDPTDLHQVQTTDRIYFDAPLVGLVNYPAWWAVIVAIDALVLALALFCFGLYRKTISLRGVGRGAVVLITSLLVPTIVTLAGWQVIRLVHPGYVEILQRDPYNSLWYFLAAAAATVAIVVQVQRRAETHATPMELAVAPTLLFGVLGLAIAIALPGASYLFCWPLFAATMCASWWRRSETRGVAAPAWLAILAVPALVLFAPLSKALLIALTADMLPFCMLLLSLMLTLLVLPLQLTGGLRRWIVAGSLAVSLVALVQAELQSGFNDVRKRPDSLSLLVDVDSAKAWWFSFDRSSDHWTASRLGSTPVRVDLSGYGFGFPGTPLLAAATDSRVVAISTAPVVTSTATDGGRRVRVHVVHAGEGQLIRLAMDTAAVVTSMSINGRALQDGRADRYAPLYHRGELGNMLRYFGVPPEGVDVEFTVSGTDAAALRIVSGVPALPGVAARPANLMSKPFLPTDMTFMAWTVKI